MTKDDLDLVPLDELKNAILRRGDHVLVAVLSSNIDGPEQHALAWGWRGNQHTAMGLADDLKAHILEQLREATR
jgi:hypothetical protein